MFSPSDLSGVDETLARRIIAYARSVAPCLDSLVDGLDEDAAKPKSDAIAILLGVAKEVPKAGKTRVKNQRTGQGAVEYFPITSAFSDDDRAALRALCAAVTPAGGLPVGSFPAPSRAVSRMWPDEC